MVSGAHKSCFTVQTRRDRYSASAMPRSQRAIPCKPSVASQRPCYDASQEGGHAVQIAMLGSCRDVCLTSAARFGVTRRATSSSARSSRSCLHRIIADLSRLNINHAHCNKEPCGPCNTDLRCCVGKLHALGYLPYSAQPSVVTRY